MIGTPYERPQAPTSADRIADGICAAIATTAVVGLYGAIWAVVVAVS